MVNSGIESLTKYSNDNKMTSNDSPNRNVIIMSTELSGVTIIIIIAGGVLTFILLFIFAKRQIMRFALRSRRGPHVPIGHDGKKSLKVEIERRIDAIPHICHEPRLLQTEDPRYIVYPGQQVPAHYHRLKAVDDIKLLETEIAKQENSPMRHPNENIRAYLLRTLAAPINGSGQRMIHQYCDLYEQARYDPSYFGEEEYQSYSRLLMKLLDAAKTLKSFNVRKSSPRSTPQKVRQRVQDKNRSLLDPSKLRPPGFAPASNDEEILSVARKDSRPTTLTISTLQAANDTETSV